MDDSRIIMLFWQRSEDAIAAVQQKYGRYCHSIAYQILSNNEDAEECVNDTYIGAWNAIPPHRPEKLSVFLGKITRNLSLKKWRAKNTAKRGGGETALALHEIEECISYENNIEAYLNAEELAEILNTFLDGLAAMERRVFLCRYWYFDSISDISVRFGFTQSKVKMMLKRTREKLLRHLEQEEIWI